MTSRIGLIFQVYAYTAVGVFLLGAPWSPVWEAATLTFAPTPAGEFVRSGVLRGFVSGLGGLNLWVAIEQGARLMHALPDHGGPA